MMANRILLALVIVFGVAALSIPQVRIEPGAETIEGTWIVDLAVPGDPPGIQFLTTYMRGGTIVTDGNAVRPTLRSAWHGSFVRLAYRDFAATSVRWNYDEAGNFTGRTEFVQGLTVNSALDGFSGRVRFLVFDPAGNLVRTREGTVQARRVGVRALE